jgi:hypothetical protein
MLCIIQYNLICLSESKAKVLHMNTGPYFCKHFHQNMCLHPHTKSCKQFFFISNTKDRYQIKTACYMKPRCLLLALAGVLYYTLRFTESCMASCSPVLGLWCMIWHLWDGSACIFALCGRNSYKQKRAVNTREQEEDIDSESNT